MKKLLLAPVVGVIILLGIGCGNSRSITYIQDEGDVADSTITPGEALTIVGRNRQEDKTWGLMENSKGQVLAMGEVRQVKYGKKNSTYQIEGHDSTFTLPNKDFEMLRRDSILRNEKAQKIECIIVKPEPCECEASTGIKFNKDSLTKNVEPAQRIVTSVALSDVIWAYVDGASRQIPQLPAELIENKDTAQYASYALVIEVNGKALCDLLPLNRVEDRGETIQILYRPSMRIAGKLFENRKDGPTYKGKPITAFKVLTDYVAPGKALSRKHAKRERKRREEKRKEHNF